MIHCPSLPGAIFKRQCLDSLGLTTEEAAKMLDIKQNFLIDFINGKVPISEELANRLANVFGSTSQTWLDMDCAYKSWYHSQLNTENVVYSMLTENTGKHFLDSGMENDRHWQQNRLKTIKEFKLQNKIVEWNIYNEKLECSVSYPVFRFLVDNLNYNEEQTKELRKYEKPDRTYLEDILDYVENTFEITEPKSFNTYEMEECSLSQVIQFSFIEYGEKNYVILQVHNGCDVRGGYTKPVVFDSEDFEDFMCALSSTSRVYDPYKKETYYLLDLPELDFVVFKDDHYENELGDIVDGEGKDYVLEGTNLMTHNDELVE